VCVLVCVCLRACMHNEEYLCLIFPLYFASLPVCVCVCLWAFPYIREREREASKPSQASKNDLLPQIACSRSPSGEGKIWGEF